jgi:adenylate cyclase
MRYSEQKLVLFTVDLAGYARASAGMDALAVARLLDDWYRRCARVVAEAGGRLVKFMGDACLATFPEDRALAAVDAAITLRRDLASLCVEHGVRVDLAGRVHTAVVAAGEFGPDDDLRYDVLGSGVNHLFMMGGGPGIRISEPVYRQLPNERRGAWDRQKAPATYSFAP